MPRTTAGGRVAQSPRAERTTGGRRTAAAGAERTMTGGVQRPGQAAGREKRQQSGERERRAGVGGGGWAGYKKAKDQRSERYQRFEVEKNRTHIIRFAEDEPFAFIFRHWVSNRPYTCIRDDENEVLCPLCDAGDRPKEVVFYNVIDLSDQAKVKVWEMSVDPTRKVRKHYDALAAMEPPRALDDTGFYFGVSKEQKERSSWEYSVDRIKARDLAEDYGIDPLDDDELAPLLEKLYDDSIIYVSSREKLEEAVSDLD